MIILPIHHFIILSIVMIPQTGSKIIPSTGSRIKPTSVYVTRMSTVYTTVVGFIKSDLKRVTIAQPD